MTVATTLDPFLEAVIPAVRRAERFLGPEDDWVEDDRRILYEAAQRHLGHLHTFTREKGPADYVTTVHADSDVVEEALVPPYQRNLVSTRKYRTHHGRGSAPRGDSGPNRGSAPRDGGKQWACGSFVIPNLDGDHGYTEQHHVYLFESPNGQTDVYAHRETAASEGAEHLTETHQEKGDPHVLFDVFDRAGLEYGQRETLK